MQPGEGWEGAGTAKATMCKKVVKKGGAAKATMFRETAKEGVVRSSHV